jgi:yecA family protein
MYDVALQNTTLMNSDYNKMLDYCELNKLLTMLGSDADASDCHGFLCGHICVNESPMSKIWEEYLDIHSNDEKLTTEFLEEIEAMVSEIIRLLESPEYDFSLLLPDDNTSISDRVSALSEWCHGFLNGFAQRQDADQALEDEDVRELIENFTRICQLEVTEHPDESDEKALFELVEYVRMGAIFINLQCHPTLPGRSLSGAFH